MGMKAMGTLALNEGVRVSPMETPVPLVRALGPCLLPFAVACSLELTRYNKVSIYVLWYL